MHIYLNHKNRPHDSLRRKTMFQIHDIRRNAYMLTGSFAKKGYDWWWHSFTAVDSITGEERPFFIEFFLCNPDLAEEEPVLGQLPANKIHHKKPSYLMVKAGCWGDEKVQLHRFFSWKDVNVNPGIPFSVSAKDCYVSENAIRGSVSVSKKDSKKHPEWMSDAGEMSWDLLINKEIAFNVGYGASRLFRDIKAFEMYWHAEGMKSKFAGSITLNGRKYDVIPGRSFGYADKNWGSNFTSPWVWLSSNDLRSKITGKRLKNSVFDIGGGRPKVFFVPLNRKLLGAFWYEGEEYEYNFSKFWMSPKTEFSFKEGKEMVYWHVRQENRDSVMDTKIVCKKKDMLLVNYESPDGRKRHKRLFNGGNGKGNIKLYKKTENGLELIDDIRVGHVGCEYGEY